MSGHMVLAYLLLLPSRRTQSLLLRRAELLLLRCWDRMLAALERVALMR